MKKYNKYIRLIALVLLCSILCVSGFTFAKYVSTSVWDYYLKSKGFYFSSDFLGNPLVKNVNNQWKGESIYFNVNNSLNQAVITEYDINYNAECKIEGDVSSYAECRLNGTDSNVQEGVLTSYQSCVNKTGDGIIVTSLDKTNCELGGYDWVNQIAEKDIYFDVVLTDESYDLKDVVVNIIVTSKSPYHKKLYGNFLLHKINLEEENITMEYKNYSSYDRLIISNPNSSNKCVKLNWDSKKLIIDTDKTKLSSYLTDSNDYINEIKFNIGGKKSLSYIFYKKNPVVTGSVSEFLIEESTDC